MLKDLVPQFAKVLNEYPDFRFDNYNLKEGVYFRFSLDRSFKENVASPTYLIVQKNGEEKASKETLTRWFKERDYYSSVLNDDMNKAVDVPSKKIHSTNYLTLFAKSDVMLGNDPKFPTSKMKAHLQKFFQESLPRSEKRLQELYPIKKQADRKQQLAERSLFFQEHYSFLIEYLESEERKEHFQKVQCFWEEHFLDFVDFAVAFVKEHHVENYIKVFFEVSEEIYEREYELYILPRIFNVNDYNEIIDDEIVGLPAYDVSMNTKKPFFELKTMKTKVPTRVTLPEALHIKDLYKWLERQGKFKVQVRSFHDLFGPEEGTSRLLAKGAYHFRIDGSGSIDYFDNVPFKQDETIDLQVDNVLQIEEDIDGVKVLKTYQPIHRIKTLHKEISRLFFGGFMQGNFLNGDPPKVQEQVFTSEMQSILVIVRQALYDFLYKGTTLNIVSFIRKYSLQLIEIQLLKTVKGLSYRRLADAYQLRLALIKDVELKEELGMADIIEDVYKSLKTKLQAKEVIATCENEEEFLFLAGQLAYYLLNNSGAEKKHYGMAEPILKARNIGQLKKRMEDLFETYSHAIHMNYLRFNNGMAMFLGFETNVKLEGKYKSVLLAGLLANNLFLQANEQGEKNPVNGKKGEK